MKTTHFFACVVGTVGALIASGAWAEGGRPHEWDGNQSTPVHLLPMVDEDGFRILPSYKEAMPFSVRNTCGPCHNYETVSGGFHFNSSDPDARHGRPGEPWIWVDEGFGTQLPLSYRRWPGTFHPDDLGVSTWDFTRQFGRHLPGGDMAEPEDLYTDPDARWHISGRLEVNCLGCHNESVLQDPSEWAKQIARENFRWAATAASDLGSVTGMASRLPISWEMHEGDNPDDHVFAVPPKATYEVDAFNAKDLTQFRVEYRVKDKNCLYCHSAADIHAERWEQDMDVHRTSGMVCVDCHRNGLNHDIIRGYEGEAQERGEPVVGDFTCVGCHLGNPAGEGISEHGGRLGAPKPMHEGLPTIHFDKLTCTACHSGRWPEDEPSHMRLARANRTGIHGVAQWFTERPYIQEPVFLPQADGKIAPHRAMWPAFWAKIEGENVTPLMPQDIQDVASGILMAEEQVGSLLARMSTIMLSSEVATTMNGLVVMLTPGHDFRVNVDGKLDVKEYEIPTAENPRNPYPRFDGEYLWAVEKDIYVLDENGVTVLDENNDPEMDFVQVQPLLHDFEPAAALELEYAQYDELLAVLKALNYQNPTDAEPVVVNGNMLYKAVRNVDTGLLDLDSEALGGQTFDGPQILLRKEGAFSPLIPDFVPRSIQVTAGTDIAFVEEQVEVMLTALNKRDGGDYGYVGNGRLFRLQNSKLAATDHPAAEPYAWPVGHEVRPAEQSLGSGGCAECHAKDAPFLMSRMESKGPLSTDDTVTSVAHEKFEMPGAAYPKTALFFKLLIVGTMTLLIIHIILDVYRQMTHSPAS